MFVIRKHKERHTCKREGTGEIWSLSLPLQRGPGPSSEDPGELGADPGRVIFSPASTPRWPRRDALGFLRTQEAPPAWGGGLDFHVPAMIPQSMCEDSAGWAPRGPGADPGLIKGKIAACPDR